MRLVCRQCGCLFPAPKSSTQFCSHACKCVAQTTGRAPGSVAVRAAANAHAAIRRALKSGKLVRPTVCEECNRSGIEIEAAHKDYARPLDVRWLCLPCHRRWDRAEPKGGVVKIALAEVVTPSPPAAAGR